MTNINTKTFNMFNAQETGSVFTQVVDRLPELGLQTFYVTSGGTNCRFLTIRVRPSAQSFFECSRDAA